MGAGEPSRVLELRSRPAGEPARGEVRVRVLAAGLNFLDVLACRGQYPRQPPFPVPLGVELCGEVAASGEGCTLQAGSTVLGIAPLPFGALAEELVVPEWYLHALRTTTPRRAVELAALPVNYQTAHFALHRLGRLRAGEVVLVTAAAGGVGTATTQLALAAGARVIALAGSEEKLARCVAEGAELAIPSGDGALVERVLDATEGAGADVVVDSVGGRLLGHAVACAAFEGRVVSVGVSSGEPTWVDLPELYARNVSVAGMSWGEHYPRRASEAVAAVYEQLLAMLDDGRVAPRLEVVGFEDVPDALERLATRRTVGKLVASVVKEAP